MKYLLFIALVSCLIIACDSSSGGGSGSSPIVKQEYVSPDNPCQNNECNQQQVVTFEQAIDHIKKIDRTPIKGMEIKLQVTEDDSYYTWEDGQTKEVICQVSYYKTRLLLDYDQNYIFVEEKINGLRVKPQSKDCRDLINNQNHYPKYLIAKESRVDAINLNGVDSTPFEKLNYKTFSFNQQSALSINGPIDIEVATEDEMGNVTTFMVKLNVDMITYLNKNFFESGFYRYILTKIESENETVSLGKMISSRKGVKVDHINVWLMDPCDFDNRTDEEDNCSVTSSNSSLVQPNFKHFFSL